jgi:hypothetical protein
MIVFHSLLGKYLTCVLSIVAQAGHHLQLAALHVCVGQQTLTLGMNDT